MDQEITVDPKLVEAFHLMYDHFPEGAQLAHKSKRIVAVNPAMKTLGREVGTICAGYGAPEAHKGCLAAKTVKHQKATWAKGAPQSPGGQEPITLWLPIDGYPDFFIHFGVGYMKDYAVPPEID